MKYKHPAELSVVHSGILYAISLIRYNQVTTNNVTVFKVNCTESMCSHFLKIKPITLKFRVTPHRWLRRIFLQQRVGYFTEKLVKCEMYKLQAKSVSYQFGCGK